jgi:hypothetical protein
MLGILYHGTKIEANSRNSIRNHLGNRKLSEFRSKPFRRGDKYSELHSIVKKKKQTLGIPF